MPDKMPESQVRTYKAHPEAVPKAIVVHCGDPKFQEAFRGFISNELGLGEGEYIPLVVSGGGGALTHPIRLPKEFKFMKERLEFYRKHAPTTSRIVVINHEGCRYYQELRSKVTGLAEHCTHEPHHDLAVVGEMFTRFLSRLDAKLELLLRQVREFGKDRNYV